MAAPHSVSVELEAWKEVHKHLSHAIIVAQEGVSVAKAQRRYWLEEIAANVSPEGKLEASSVWLKPVQTQKNQPRKRGLKAKKKPASSQKRKKSDETLTDDEGTSPPSKPLKKRRPAKKRPLLPEPEPEDEPENNVLRLTLKSAIAPPPISSGPAQFTVSPIQSRGGVALPEVPVSMQESEPAGSVRYDPQMGGQVPHWTAQSSLHAAVAAANPENFQLMERIPEHLRPFLAAAQTAALSGGLASAHPSPPPDATSHFSTNVYDMPPQHDEDAVANSDEDY